MGLKDIKAALAGFDTEWQAPIYKALNGNAATLYRGASQQEFLLIAEQLSKVSGGSGLDLIALLLLPDGGADEFKQQLSDDIRYRLQRYGGGQVRNIEPTEKTEIATLELIAINEALMAANAVVMVESLSSHPLVIELQKKLKERYEVAMKCRREDAQ